MKRSIVAMASIAMLSLSACGGSQPPAASATPAAATAASPDAELEQLKTTTPVDACATLTPEKLKTVYPDLTFDVHQKIDPQMSGYVWDSRCVYWAGVGTIDFAKDAPTHTVEIFIATSATPEKAKANLASRHELATTTSGYQAQPTLGENAYSATDTGMGRLFFVKGQSEIQINVSDLKTTNDAKVKNAIALAQSL
ncbi:MAG: hypothetical protein E6Q50_08665 [Lysobacter sp.]|nr:MAG: hypothetical protein E6Q50_08665 [Lysobacter sp.]